MAKESLDEKDRFMERRDLLRSLAGTVFAAATASDPVGALADALSPSNRIDIHHHFVPPMFAQSAQERKLFHPSLNGMSVTRSLDEMDRNGVASAVLSIPPPGVWYGDAELARRIARDANDHAARLVSDHKGRFGMFATLPLPDVDGALVEMAYAFDQLKADGIQMWTSYGDFWLGDPRLSPLLEELNRRKSVVYTHPTVPSCCAQLVPEAPVAMIEFSTDTTRSIASLVLSGTTNRYPDIRWIFSHAGGTMPSLLERLLSGRSAIENA